MYMYSYLKYNIFPLMMINLYIVKYKKLRNGNLKGGDMFFVIHLVNSRVKTVM